MAKQALPTFLEGVISYDDYNRWLEGKAKSHVVRDRKRGFPDTSPDFSRDEVGTGLQ